MKYILIIFANWILRRCLRSSVSFSDCELYINGRTYYLITTTMTTKITPAGNKIITMEVISKDKYETYTQA